MAELSQREFAALGGEARAKALSPTRRREIARQAALARWGKRAKHYAAKKR